MKSRITAAHLFERFTMLVKRFAFSTMGELRKCCHGIKPIVAGAPLVVDLRQFERVGATKTIDHKVSL